MKQNFTKALNLVLEYEGGYVNDPTDTGGETCFGITRKNHPSLEMWEIIDHLKKINTPVKNIGKLAAEYNQVKSSVESVYKKKYWDVCRCDDLPAKLDFYVFDSAVQHGTKNAGKFLQKLLKITVDGIIGKQSVASAKSFTGDQKQYLEIRRAFYDQIIKKNPTQEKFRKGWYNRLNKLSQV